MDAVDPQVNTNCQPPSGSGFSVGGTEVQCYATYSAGNQSPTRFFLVNVKDTKPPALELPDNITLEIDSLETVLTFEVNATDEVDSDPTILCIPPSGSKFGEGGRSPCELQCDRFLWKQSLRYILLGDYPLN